MAVENMTLAPYYSGTRNPFNYQKIEQISRDLTTGWLTLDEITQQLNLFGDESQDQYLTGLELATRMAIEDFLGMSVFPIQYRTYYGDPGLNGTAVYLDLPEATPTTQYGTGTVINKVSYYTGDSNSVKNTLAASNYYYDPTGNRVVVSSGLPAPLAQNIANPVEVEFTVNANFVAQYPVVKQAALMLLTHIYNNRSDTTGPIQHKIPWGVEVLLRPYKPLVM